MKATFTLKTLKAAVKQVSAVVPKRTSKETLRNILVTVGESITFMGSDSETYLQIEVDGEIEKPGLGLFSAAFLSQFIRCADGDTITLEAGQTNCVRCGGDEFRFAGDNPDDFIPFPTALERTVTVDVADLKSLLKQTHFACDVDSSRYALGGVQLEVKESKLFCAATDSRRLAVVSISCEGVLAPFVLPKKTATAFMAAFPVDGQVDVAFSGKTFIFQCGKHLLIGRPIEGRFPNWRTAIPARSAQCMKMTIPSLIKAAKQADLVRNIEQNGTDIRLAETEAIFTTANGHQSVVSKIPVSGNSSDQKLLIDCELLRDMRLFGDGDVSLSCLAPGDPVRFDIGANATYLVSQISRDGATA